MLDENRYGPIYSEIRSYLLRDTVLFSPRYSAIFSEIQCYLRRSYSHISSKYDLKIILYEN